MRTRRRGKIIIRLALLTLLAAGCFIMSSCDPVLTLNPKYSYTSFGLELGQPVPDDIEEYVDLSELSDEDRQFVLDNTEILYDGEPVKGQTFDSEGKHTLTIRYKGSQYRKYDITVIDHEPPVFTAARDINTYTGQMVDESEIENMFEASDNSGSVSIKTSDMDVDYDKPGEYVIRAVAEDPSGNSAETTAVIRVQDPYYGMEGTYIWVSIGNQQLTYFVDGEIALNTPVVTGNAGNHDTPKGQYSVINKARNVTLKGREDNGEKYESFVKYWMAFLGSEYGIHDADWRTTFGGSIYMGDGSHGCINMPPALAEQLYAMVETGTPVFVFQ